MGILSGNPKDEPMHYGEVFGAWTYLTVNYGCLAAYQAFINHAGDDDLKRLLEESMQAIKSENQQIEDLLKANGVALPPSPPEKPVANLEEIPVGARFNDPEISAALAMNVAKGLVACSTIMGESIREDIGVMFGQFHISKAALGVKVLELNKEKGWLVPPPLHLNTTNQE